MRLWMVRALLVAAALAAPPALAQTAPANPAPRSTITPAPATATKAPPAAATLIDINSASKDELDALPQIGASRAEAIIKGRPYKGKNDLRDKKVIPDNAYEAIKDRIIARQ